MKNFPRRATVNYSRDNSHRSFTLIELLIVVTIIWFEAAIAVPGLLRIRCGVYGDA